MRVSSIVVAVACATLPASAHSFGKGVGDFYAGMLHPLTAIEHLLAWFATALWAGQQQAWTGQNGSGTSHRALVAFPLGLVLGGVLGRVLPDLGWVGPLNLGLIVLVGVAVAARWQPPRPVFLALVFLVGLAQGHANTSDLDLGASVPVFLCGTALVAVVLSFLLIEAVLALKRPWMQIAVRALGSWIAAVGLMVAAVVLRSG